MVRQSRISSAAPVLLSFLRVVVGLNFCSHGIKKALTLFAGGQLPALLKWACFLESVGGVLILVGFFTVPVALILSGEMAVGYFVQHFPKGILPIQNGGELAVLYCFIFLYFLAAGPGPISLDHLFQSHKTGSQRTPG